MTTEAAQAIVESHSDLIYIEITAWATVAMVIATIGMIVWQIKAAKAMAKVELSMRLMEQYDSTQMRENRRILARHLLQGMGGAATSMEPVLDALETIAVLHRREWLDVDITENAFSIPVRYWWCALEGDVAIMRSKFNNKTLYDELEKLAGQYTKAELEKRRHHSISSADVEVFLNSEAPSIY
jgi:hypothetical protein